MRPLTEDWDAVPQQPKAVLSVLPEWEMGYFLCTGGEVAEGVDEDGVQEGDCVEVV